MRIETQRELLRRFFELRAAHTTTMAPAVYRQRASVYFDPEEGDPDLIAVIVAADNYLGSLANAQELRSGLARLIRQILEGID